MTDSAIVAPVSCPVCHASGSSVERSSGATSLLRCAACGLVYASRMETSADLYEDAYTTAGVYHDYLEPPVDEEAPVHLDWAMRRFLGRVPPAGRLLDVGCSTGRFLVAANRAGWEPHGIDVSARAAAIAGRIAGVPTMAGTISDLPSDEVYDAITAWDTLEHVTDPSAFLDAGRRHLRSGGVFAVSVPNWSSPWMRSSRNAEHWPPYHLTFWEPKTLRDLFEAAGFADVSIVEKPIAWGEEVGRKKWLYLPVAVLRSVVLHQRGMHVLGIGTKP